MSDRNKPTEEDLAAQLRANLRRRKQAARKTAGADGAKKNTPSP